MHRFIVSYLSFTYELPSHSLLALMQLLAYRARALLNRFPALTNSVKQVKLAPNHEANRALARASTLVSPYSSFDTCKYRLGHTGSSINVKNDKSGPEAEVGEGKGVQGGSRDSGHVSSDLTISIASLINMARW
jgi:hypothetical protein